MKKTQEEMELTQIRPASIRVSWIADDVLELEDRNGGVYRARVDTDGGLWFQEVIRLKKRQVVRPAEMIERLIEKLDQDIVGELDVKEEIGKLIEELADEVDQKMMDEKEQKREWIDQGRRMARAANAAEEKIHQVVTAQDVRRQCAEDDGVTYEEDNGG